MLTEGASAGRRTLRKWAPRVLLALLAAAVMFVAGAVARLYLTDGGQALLLAAEEIERSGDPIGFEDHLASRPVDAPEPDCTALWEELARAGFVEDWIPNLWGHPWQDAAVVQSASRELSEHPTEVALIHQIADCGGSLRTLPTLPNRDLALCLEDDPGGLLNAVHHAERVLRFEAWQAAWRGDAVAAERALVRMLRVNTARQANPVPGTGMIQARVGRSTSMRILCRVMGAVLLDDGQLARLEAALVDTSPQDRLRDAYLLHRALLAFGVFDQLPLGVVGGRGSWRGWLADASSWARLADEFAAAGQLICEASRPFPQRLDSVASNQAAAFARAETRGDRLGPLHRMGLVTESAFLAAVASIARTAIAVGRFRAAMGRLPERLEELVPRWLNAIPTDPFDGQPLRYRVTDKGFRIYSVANPDGFGPWPGEEDMVDFVRRHQVDDGGRTPEESREMRRLITVGQLPRPATWTELPDGAREEWQPNSDLVCVAERP